MLNYISKKHSAKTFSVSPENFTGEKGKGGMAVEGTGAEYASGLGRGWKISPSVCVDAGTQFTLADIKGQGAIKHIWITYVGEASLRELILRIYWDGENIPAAEVPLGDFFASANGEYRQLSSLAVCVNPLMGMNCYWEMPYRTGFKMTLENRSTETITVYYQIDCENKKIDDEFLYFHAYFKRSNPLKYCDVHTILDNVSGSGHYVGTYIYWGVYNNGWWGEGEVKFYIDDDSDFPTVCGTGTEDYFGGSHNFDIGGKYAEYTTNYSGMYKIDNTDETYKAVRRFNMYRWHICDPIYFEKKLRVTVQGLGWRKNKRYLPLQDDISSVAFWYSDKKADYVQKLPTKDELEII